MPLICNVCKNDTSDLIHNISPIVIQELVLYPGGGSPLGGRGF